jgi:uncharacterized protein
MRYPRTGLVMAAAVIIASSSLAGCSSILAPRPDVSKFFILTAGESGIQPTGVPLNHVTIGLGPVRLPAYLDRAEIVTRTEPNRLELSDTDKWAEPVEANFRRVLAMDLAARLVSAQIVQFPWYSTTRLDYKVEVSVDRFERDASGSAHLIARWTIRDGVTNKLLAQRDSSFSESAKSSATADSVAAMSNDIEDLSVQIASEMRRLSDQTRAG